MRGIAFLAATAFAAFAATQAGAQQPAPLASATQLLVVTTPDWDAPTGELRRYSRRTPGEPWRAEGGAAPVVVGHAGLGWGIGFERSGPRKVEGDGRAPAGAFAVGHAFGFAPVDSTAWLRMPYMPLTMNTECVDDAASAHYNTVLERDTAGRVDWNSAERMRRIPQYEIGFIVDYNAAPRTRGRGSCIFFHIWEQPGAPTVGCTAMNFDALASLMAWLDPRARPAVVQLPAAVYRRMRAEWKLP